MKKTGLIVIVVLILISYAFNGLAATCQEINDPLPCEEISSCGFYNRPSGAYLLLSQDISDPKSCLFLGGEIVLDLNEHTITFADDDYVHLPNWEFENWNGNSLEDWNTSGAPGLEKMSTYYDLPFIGDWYVKLPAGESITSEYIHLPVADRTYVAMVSARAQTRCSQCTITLYVEKEGEGVVESKSFTSYDSSAYFFTLAGYEPFIHFIIDEPGNYRLRIHATREHYIDNPDIRPGFDTGVAVVSLYPPWEQCRDAGFRNWWPCAAPDYGGIYDPVNYADLTIINGRIEAGFPGFYSHGILTYNDDLNGELNVQDIVVETSGIMAMTLDSVLPGVIEDSEFYTHQPWLFTRHNTYMRNLNLKSDTIFRNNHAEGGQGVISGAGQNIDIHDNYIINDQQFTNHYAVSTSGTDINVYNNVFEPIHGSGIYARSTNSRIYGNVFYTQSEIRNIEYGDRYSTNSIRLGDYGGCDVYDNYIYDNTFHVTGHHFSQYSNYFGSANAIFYSVCGDNYIDNNTFITENTDYRADAFAMYIGGAGDNGYWRNNLFQSNDAAGWIASPYGNARGQHIINNTFEKIGTPPEGEPCDGYSNFKFGSFHSYDAYDINFVNNHYINTDITDNCYYAEINDNYEHSYLWWVNVQVNSGGSPLAGAEIQFTSAENVETTETTGSSGFVQFEILDWYQTGSAKFGSHTENIVDHNPYTIRVSKLGWYPQTILRDINEETDLVFNLEEGEDICLLTDEDQDTYSTVASCGDIDCNDANPAVHPGAEELCDGLDNDCDNDIDEGITGSNCTQVGVCAGTVNSCENGEWTDCDYASNPDFEVAEQSCDGLDNDCDGQIDESCPCVNGNTQNCGPVNDTGACRFGTQVCALGVWGNCTGAVFISDEICNNIDDNCDGVIDELLRNCSTAEIKPPCASEWDCTGWGECIDQRKTRDCVDTIGCNVSTDKPDTSSFCFSSSTHGLSGSGSDSTDGSDFSWERKVKSGSSSGNDTNSTTGDDPTDNDFSNFYFYGSFILIAVILFVILFMIKKESITPPENKLTKEEEIQLETMDILKQEISRLKKLGKTEREIRSTLRSKRWKNRIVDLALGQKK